LAETILAERFDAVVIGGGPGGATAALLLARAGWSVAVVERKAFPRRKVCGEYLSGTNLPLLRLLGLDEVFRDAAGPEVTHFGLFARDETVVAGTPLWAGRPGDRGRALGREHLDTLLLANAVAAGAEVFQPWAARGVVRNGPAYSCRIEAFAPNPRTRELVSPVVIAAHNYWEPGRLPTQPPQCPADPHDLLAFKAHFRDCALQPGLMPLLVFPDGYGGLVHTDGGRVSASFCVRRGRVDQLRTGRDGGGIGQAVLDYIRDHCRGAADALDGAAHDGPWLSTGPLRPGIRVRAACGLFAVGNAAGEAHPAVAEGISMAMQSAWLLARRIIRNGRGYRGWHGVGLDYARTWRRHFAPRVWASTVIAAWAVRGPAVRGTLPALRAFPELVNWWARLSGKGSLVVAGRSGPLPAARA
jgi:flavin-dependent dehydrogenase